MAWWMIFITLLSLSMRMSALDFFPEKFVLGEKRESVTLTCHTDKDSVVWKREDLYGNVELVQESEVEKLNGRELIVDDLQKDLIGNYTCWSDNTLLDHTYLLLDVTKESTAYNINCIAETFSCSEKLKCSWTSDEFTAFRLRNTRDNGDWVSQSVDGVFYLPHSTNSYSEESERLVITGEAVSSCCYMKTNYSFFLRDIVKPAGPEISKCRSSKMPKAGHGVEVEVKPPSTWPQPHSFFPLKHEIQYEIRHNGQMETREWEGSKVTVQGVIGKLRVRCRDLFLLSQWSEWTPWQNVSKKKGRKRTKTEKQLTKTRHKSKKQQRKDKKKGQSLTWAKRES